MGKIQTFKRAVVVALPTPERLALARKTPSCEDGGKEFHLTLSEQRNESAHCGSCGERFPTKRGAEKVTFPKHNISPELHEFRQKLMREEVEAKARAERHAA